MAGGAALPLAFGALVAGAVVIDYGTKHMGRAFSSNSSATVGSGNVTLAPSSSVQGFPSSVDPLPGAMGSRLDQGIDGTGHSFLSPWNGTVVVSNTHDPGWAGGGYIAIEAADVPDKVYYLAEGIVPTLKAGQKVSAGDRIAFPVASPYNGIIGNFEAGLADPRSPSRPLAQAVSNSVQAVDDFYSWLQSVSRIRATSTAHAGHA